MDISKIDESVIKSIRRTYDIIKNLKEEKRSIVEDISEEKKELSKNVGLSVKDLNFIFKIIESREKGEFSDDYLKIAKSVEGILALNKE